MNEFLDLTYNLVNPIVFKVRLIEIINFKFIFDY